MAKRGRPRIHQEDIVMVSRRLPLSLWNRFQEFCAEHLPRTSDTAHLEAALIEYLDRHEPKQKGEK